MKQNLIPFSTRYFIRQNILEKTWTPGGCNISGEICVEVSTATGEVVSNRPVTITVGQKQRQAVFHKLMQEIQIAEPTRLLWVNRLRYSSVKMYRSCHINYRLTTGGLVINIFAEFMFQAKTKDTFVSQRETNFKTVFYRK